jgi:glycosyltransferase involved in cell wall biosynthesis
VNIHQLATALSYGDAISDEMLEFQKALRNGGFSSEIFVRFYEPRMAAYVKDFREYPRHSSASNVVIFHFSIGSPVSKMVFRIPDKKIMIYHNITPHSHFLDYHRILTRECYKGRLEIKQFVDKVDLALGDSDFNRRELEEAGYPHTGVQPLLLDFTKFDDPGSPAIKSIFDGDKFTILFVGRVIPNKKFENVIKAFHCYKKYFNPRSRLILAGDYRGMERYFSALMDLVDRLALQDVHFTGHVDFAELLAYFRTADVYLSMSEHEGFGVPLLESFHLGIPVIALAAGAVEETMNGGGVLLRRPDAMAAAALMEKLRGDADFREAVCAGQRKALRKYHADNVSRILLEHVKEVAGR